MVKLGTLVKMTKGYRGIEGVVVEKTESQFELYILKLDNGLNLIAGPSAFIPLENKDYIKNPFKNEEEKA